MPYLCHRKTIKTMKRLINAIKSGRFNYENYLSGGTYYGMKIQTQPLFCSYGMIGFQVYSPYGDSFEGTIEWDWEMKKITIIN